MTSQLNVALIHKLRGSLIYLAYFFDMLAIGLFTNRLQQTSGRLVQELNVCTVHRNFKFKERIHANATTGRSANICAGLGKPRTTREIRLSHENIIDNLRHFSHSAEYIRTISYRKGHV